MAENKPTYSLLGNGFRRTKTYETTEVRKITVTAERGHIAIKDENDEPGFSSWFAKSSYIFLAPDEARHIARLLVEAAEKIQKGAE